MMISAVDDRYLDGQMGDAASGGQASEAGAYDYYPRLRFGVRGHRAVSLGMSEYRIRGRTIPSKSFDGLAAAGPRMRAGGRIAGAAMRWHRRVNSAYTACS